uniref:Uncharacterized protein n=1 Tax=Lepeophtheirus salmonis TaxID=72036 RepID=A0A0K2U305_LEPSM
MLPKSTVYNVAMAFKESVGLGTPARKTHDSKGKQTHSKLPEAKWEWKFGFLALRIGTLGPLLVERLGESPINYYLKFKRRCI